MIVNIPSNSFFIAENSGEPSGTAEFYYKHAKWQYAFEPERDMACLRRHPERRFFWKRILPIAISSTKPFEVKTNCRLLSLTHENIFLANDMGNDLIPFLSSEDVYLLRCSRCQRMTAQHIESRNGVVKSNHRFALL